MMFKTNVRLGKSDSKSVAKRVVSGIIGAVCLMVIGELSAQTNTVPAALTYQKGRLVYTPDTLGNRIPDFSYAGYRGAEVPIPDVSIKAVVEPSEGDATQSIEQAINYVGGLKPDKDGFRGTVLLKKGTYRVWGKIAINVSGVVLRGSGVGVNGTKIIAMGRDRRTLISVLGGDKPITTESVTIVQPYVAVGSLTIQVSPNHGLKKGDKIFVVRPSTKEWIDRLGTNHFGGGITALGWKPLQHNISWDRTVVEVWGNTITIDAPITTAIDEQFGGGYILPYLWSRRISEVGVENLECISQSDSSNPKDENHAWTGISINNAEDCWVRNVVFTGFAGSAVAALEGAKRITVENCKSLAPISEIGGQRRNSFFTSGQQCLFQRLYSQDGWHDFAVGYCAAGPNAFVQCHADRPNNFSGSVGSWASGVLFDIVNIDGKAIRFKNLMQQMQGTGWNAANSVMWQCTASLIECFAPPTAMNWSFGSWAEFSGDGNWNESNNNVKPRSLYYAQLQERLGERYVERSNLLPVETEASSSPPISIAMELTAKAAVAPLTLCDWIDSLISVAVVDTQVGSAKVFVQTGIVPSIKTAQSPPLSIRNGWLTRGNTVQTGNKHDISWWSGSVKPDYLKKTASPHLTRFVPSRTGTGLTDDISSVVEWMKSENVVSLDHNYGLWYDRRRDDHQRIRRIDGEVWAPFYEQPFARSGEGVAYDGLSRYDLTKYNHWYWLRLRQFADQADANSLILLHQNYFQHNIIEAGAHWADSPWRPANNINNTGFPEPAPYAGDKRIFLAEQFYDINNPIRRELHRAYIRQCLDNFTGSGSVIQFVSAEYTGPLHFVEFWLDVIAQWENQTGERQLIALSTTKDVQDSILADPIRSKIVDVIDIRYWFYRNDSTTYAPLGGQNLAPRQHARLTKPGSASFESVYRAVDEYKTLFPEKAVVYYSDSYPQYAWAIFMAQGSLAAIPKVDDVNFLTSACSMSVMKRLNRKGQYVLGNPETGYIVYTTDGAVKIHSADKTARYQVRWVDPQTGAVTREKKVVKGAISINHTSGRAAIAWIVKL